MGNITLCIKEIMALAMANRATDIHLKAHRIFMRIDTVMYLVLDDIQGAAFISLIRGFHALTKGPQINQRKTNTGSFVHEALAVSQPGRNVSGKLQVYKIACRITVLPTTTGIMAAYIRLRDSHRIPPLDKLGLLPEDLEMIQRIVIQQYRGMGVFLVTGPTNSGKSTLLLSILDETYKKAGGGISVATIEEPVEVIDEKFAQISINSEAGITFSDAVKDILTCDQDVLYIGEIRDQASAKVVFRASATGHLAVSTLHARDTLHTFERLRDLGISTSEMSGHLLGIAAQRLLPRLCPKCREMYDASEDIEELERMGYAGFKNGDLFRRKEGGCEYCRGRGVRGMVTVLEILDVTEKDFRLALSEGSVSMSSLLELSNKQHMRTLFDSGVRRIRNREVSFKDVASSVHQL